MSADEIRRLADSNAIHRPKCKSSEKFPRCREWCPAEESKKCKEADEIRAALLAYAAMVERCENLLKDYDLYGSVSEANKLKTDICRKHVNYILKGVKDERK